MCQFSIILSLLLLLAPAATTAQTYHAGDIAVINDIIANNGLDWTEADPADGSYVPADWSSVVVWNTATPRRITRLDIVGKNLTGVLDVTGLTSLETLWCFANNLTTLDVSNCTALEELRCS